MRGDDEIWDLNDGDPFFAEEERGDDPNKWMRWGAFIMLAVVAAWLILDYIF